MAKCLVIGGAGFIGSNLVVRLVADEHEVTVVDNLFLGVITNLDEILEKIEFHQTDLTNAHETNILKDKKFDFIFLVGNYSSAPMFKKESRKRLNETFSDFLHALELAKDNNAKLIYASTSSIQGPRTYYSGAREVYETLASIYFNESKVNSIGLRYFSVYGGDKYHETHKKQYANTLTQMYWEFKKGKNFVIFGDGSQTRDFIHVLDIVEATVKAMAYNKSGAHVFEIGSGIAHSFNDTFKMLTECMKIELKPEYIENPLKNYVQHTCSTEYKKAMKELDWKPKINLAKGISMLVKDN